MTLKVHNIILNILSRLLLADAQSMYTCIDTNHAAVGPEDGLFMATPQSLCKQIQADPIKQATQPFFL